MEKKLTRAQRSKQAIKEGLCGYCLTRKLIEGRKRCRVCTEINRKNSEATRKAAKPKVRRKLALGSRPVVAVAIPPAVA